MRRWALPAAVLLAAAPAAAERKIEHVVLLMMENRPFDFYFGLSEKEIPGIDGLKGDEFNYYDPADPAKGKVTVGDQAKYVCDGGAAGSYPATMNGIFGKGNWTGTGPHPEGTMQGFLQGNAGGIGAEVMYQMGPERVPVKTALAKEFGLFDRWFVPFPGPSTPNHLFMHTGSAQGCTETGEYYHCAGRSLFPGKTIYEELEENNLTWAYYYNDSAWVDFVEYFNEPAGKAGLRGYDEFYHKAEVGELPNYSFILPRQGCNTTTGDGPNDDHPCHDIALGERLLKDTYEALRAGKNWNKTLLVVTYDDTAGWYDHVPPPSAPAPDNEPSCPDKFDFTMLGNRAPTLLISPWVPKGTVINKPKGDVGSAARPFADSEYDHTSLLAFLKNNFNLPTFLSKRDAWAGSFHDELSEAAPRADTMMHTPDAPPRASSCASAVHGGGRQYCSTCPGSLTRRQARRVKGLADLLNQEQPDTSAWTHTDAEKWINAHWAKYADNEEL